MRVPASPYLSMPGVGATERVVERGPMNPRIITMAGTTLEVVESCVYTWLFDHVRRRFRRLPRGRRIPLDHALAGWEPYERLEIDADTGTFTVVLNPQGSRLLSAGWHHDRCPCEADAGLAGASPPAEAAAPW